MKNFINVILLIALTLYLCMGCSGQGEKTRAKDADKVKLTLMKEKFGMVDNRQVYLYTLQNANGITVKITNYGGIITSVLTPDKNGKMGDIVLGYDSVKQYIANSPYFGALVGRYANRIAKGMFVLDGKTYKLAINNGNNALHGGIKGFDKVIWDVTEIRDSAQTGIELNYLSKDGEEGYPGNLSVKVIYTLNNENELQTVIEATTDKPTPVNLCNHSYFNLGCAESNILGHILMINADRYTIVNDELIPTGELPAVAGGPMDFTKPFVIGARIDKVMGGYDHNFVLNKQQGSLSLAARVEEPVSGRVLEILTTQPGVQFYTGNFLDGTIHGKGNKVYEKHWGFCLETQHFPDSPNQPAFPNTILRPGQKFHEETIFKFAVKM